MRLSFMRAGAAAIVAIALSACADHGVVPSSSDAQAMTANAGISPLALKTCATSPPQYEWIFKGACDEFTLKSTGGSFSLQEYQDVTVTGSIGKNTASGSVDVVIADALDKNGDVESYGGKSFPPYDGSGTTIVYAIVANQSTQTIKPISVKGKAVLEYQITDAKGLPGNTCGAALLAAQKGGGVKWTAFPGSAPIKGKSVTIAVYEAPAGFELPPKGTPLYFAVNCYKQ